MPTYEFVCTTCGDRAEVKATLAEKATGLAPQCGTCNADGRMRRVFSAFATPGKVPAAGPARGAGGCCGGACGCG